MIIVYDDKCSFCTKFAFFCVKKNTRIEIVSVREVKAKEILRSKGVKFISLQTIYFVTASHLFVRSTAIFEIFKLLGYPLKLITYFQIFPTSLTDYFYNVFAKYRYAFQKKEK